MKRIGIYALLLAALLLAGCNLPSNNPTALPTGNATGVPLFGQTPGGPTPAAGSTMPANTSGTDILVSTRDETNARTGPGRDYPASHLLPAGVTLRALGRSSDNAWLVISDPPDELDKPALWIASEVVDVRGDLAALPVVAGPPLPTPGPTRQGSPTPVRTLAP